MRWTWRERETKRPNPTQLKLSAPAWRLQVEPIKYVRPPTPPDRPDTFCDVNTTETDTQRLFNACVLPDLFACLQLSTNSPSPVLLLSSASGNHAVADLNIPLSRPCISKQTAVWKSAAGAGYPLGCRV